MRTKSTLILVKLSSRTAYEDKTHIDIGKLSSRTAYEDKTCLEIDKIVFKHSS
jgi:hypothetical protein